VARPRRTRTGFPLRDHTCRLRNDARSCQRGRRSRDLAIFVSPPRRGEPRAKALERLWQSSDITVLLAEQNVTFALPRADRVYVLEHARIVWEGAPAKFAAEMGTGYL
jgi:hypothetical protein